MGDRLRDGHVHTPYCPHGTADALESYIKKAIERGLKEITFTEHMPLPKTFLRREPNFLAECAPSEKDFIGYFEEIKTLRKDYQQALIIHTGLEVDYIEGYEAETKSLLDFYGPYIEDSILSTHFVKLDQQYYCIDYLPDFEKILQVSGSLEKVYDSYFKNLIASIHADLGPYKPKRIGHPSLVRIFNQKYPFEYKNRQLLEEVVLSLKKADYQIDYNTAGLRKQFCQEAYPSGLFWELIKTYQVPFVYGSDAHTAEDIGKGFVIE